MSVLSLGVVRVLKGKFFCDVLLMTSAFTLKGQPPISQENTSLHLPLNGYAALMANDMPSTRFDMRTSNSRISDGLETWPNRRKGEEVLSTLPMEMAVLCMLSITVLQ